LREARAAAAIKHDHIVTVYQVGEDRGIPFLAMEFLEGESLESRLEREDKLLVAEVLRIGREIALGLAAAHKRDLVHRDIKPANVWLEAETGRVKILDFGLARPAECDGLTAQGAIVGTPAYMAPEQAQGKTVDRRCDLFSLGCILYRMATGQKPFFGTDLISTLMAVATQEPLTPHEVEPGTPAALSKLIMRLLAKDPAKRPASADGVVELLKAIEDQLDELTLRPGSSFLKAKSDVTWSRPLAFDWLGKGRPPLPWLAGLTAILLLIVIVGLGFFWQTTHGPVNMQDTDATDSNAEEKKYDVLADAEAKRSKASPAVASGKASTGESLPATITNSIGMKFQRVPRGTYSMGFLQTAENNDNEPVATELPQHSVTIARPFYLAVYKTTQTEFQQVLGRNPSHFSAGGAGKDAVVGLDTRRFPVDQVTFFDAIEFCIKLSERESLHPCYRLRDIERSGNGTITSAEIDVLNDAAGYRLPSEAEWEYCARAGTTMRYACTNDPAEVGDYAWFYANSNYRTHPVGEKKPNAWGFYDLGGMLYEWCEDPWHPNYENAPTDGSVWYAGGDANSRVNRGGWYRHRVWCCRCAVRYPCVIRGPSMNAFRVVRVSP
jgi:serine/threonine protein kinase